MSELKAWINALLWNFAYAWHANVVMVRSEMGRLFVFRDRPDWFVKETAALLERAKTELPAKVPLFQQAADEWALRQRRAKVAAGVKGTPAPLADWQISAIADKHRSEVDGQKVLDEVSFGRELLSTNGVKEPHACRWFNGRCLDCGRAYGEPRASGVEGRTK